MGMSNVMKCNNYGVICCPSPIPSPSSIQIPKTSGVISKRSKIIFSQNFPTLLSCYLKIECKEIESYTQTQTRIGVSILNPQGTLITSSKCKHKSIPLVVGGEKANRYEFPHQALLGYKTGRRIEWACGGSLISSRYVLTGMYFE